MVKRFRRRKGVIPPHLRPYLFKKGIRRSSGGPKIAVRRVLKSLNTGSVQRISVNMPRRRRARRTRSFRFSRARRSSRSSGSLNMKNIALMGIGAGLSGTVAGTIQRFIPIPEVVPGATKVIVGFGGLYLTKKKGGMFRPILAGIAVDGIGDVVQSLVGGRAAAVITDNTL